MTSRRRRIANGSFASFSLLLSTGGVYFEHLSSDRFGLQQIKRGVACLCATRAMRTHRFSEEGFFVGGCSFKSHSRRAMGSQAYISNAAASVIGSSVRSLFLFSFLLV